MSVSQPARKHRRTGQNPFGGQTAFCPNGLGGGGSSRNCPGSIFSGGGVVAEFFAPDSVGNFFR